MAEEVKSSSTPSSCVLIPAHTSRNYHMSIGDLCHSLEQVTSSSPPISSQDTTIARQQPVVAMEVKMAENSGATLPHDLGDHKRFERRNSSPELSASVTPITPLSRQSPGTSPGSSKMDLRRGSSDSSLPHLIEEGVVFDPTIPLPELRNLISTSNTLQELNNHPTTAHPAIEYVQQAADDSVDYAVVPYQYTIPVPIVTRPVSQVLGNQVAYGYQGQHLVSPPFVTVDALGREYIEVAPLIPQQVFVGNYQSDMYSRESMRSNWREDRRAATSSSVAGSMPYRGEQTGWNAERSVGAARAPVVVRPSPIPTSSLVGYHGFIPSSIENTEKKRGRVFGKRIGAEKKRVEDNLPTFLIEDQLSSDVDKYYAKYNGKYVEVDDYLIGNCVCPADLLQFPCRWDEFWEGCQMLRLCSQVSRYTNYTCADGGYRDPKIEGFERSSCPYLHWEVEPSCRFIAGGRECEIVTRKGFECAAGHDMEWGRRIARERFENHVKDALLAGAVGKVQSHAIILPHHYHERMPDGSKKQLPQPHELQPHYFHGY